MSLLAVNVSEFVLPAVLGLLTFFLLRRSVRRFAELRKRKLEKPRLRIVAEPGAPLATSPAGEVELHERARELIARIDSKAAALEHLLRLAEAEADRLEEALRRVEALEQKGPMGSP